MSYEDITDSMEGLELLFRFPGDGLRVFKHFTDRKDLPYVYVIARHYVKPSF